MLLPRSRRASAGRTARASLEVWALTVLAHSVAGGGLPSLPWLVGVAGLVAVSTAWVLRGSVRLAVMLPLLVGCQLVLHGLFASLSPAGQASRGHAHTHQPTSASPWWMDELSPRMVLAHVLCALLTGVVWWVRRSVVGVVLALAQPFTVAAWRTRLTPSARTSPGPARMWLFGDPGRAPPRVPAPA